MEEDIEQIWRHKARAVTKYNPIYYDSNGVYNKREWTSRSDIGKMYDSKTFTELEYYQTEAAYIKAVFMFMDFIKSDKLEIFELHTDNRCTQLCKKKDVDLYEFCKAIKNRLLIKDHDQIGQLIKLALREYIQCSLIVDKDTESRIFFGYDYYMYFVSNRNLDDIKTHIESSGLFISG